MSDLMKQLETEIEEDEVDKGPNLFVLYGLLAFAILGAMVCAALIVWPFYKHRF